MALLQGWIKDKDGAPKWMEIKKILGNIFDPSKNFSWRSSLEPGVMLVR
jgi:hypothetical protein